MGVRRHGTEAIVLGVIAGAGTLLTSLYLVPELSGAVGGLAATAVFLARRRNRLAGVPVRALLPYAFLLSLLVAGNGIGALRSVLERLGPVFDGPGLPLLISGAFAALLLGLGGDEVGATTRRTATQWLPVAGAVLTFVLASGAIVAVGVDWNETHLFNPAWHEHARFHDALMLLILCGVTIVGLWMMWRRSMELLCTSPIVPAYE